MTNSGIDLHLVESGYKSRERQIKRPFDAKEMGSLAGSVEHIDG